MSWHNHNLGQYHNITNTTQISHHLENIIGHWPRYISYLFNFIIIISTFDCIYFITTVFYEQLFNLIMYVMFLLRPFTVHNVFPWFCGPNKVIIIILLL